ncbi:MAG: adenylyltransferase [Firmicutes bacterium HGW-Firmicutes-8]|nr:MAG: adenylyltransferase [Firmicutes bacterium HGW-Firmicutes-8]
MSTLNENERKRYMRQLMLDEIGEAGQLKLKEGKVLVVGTGGLGSASLFYLAAAGVGHLGVVDSDSVDLSNLQRQILHNTDDLGKPKIESACEKLSRLNPEIIVEGFRERLGTQNTAGIVTGFDVVIDATDNFPSRFILNESCVRTGKPFIHGGIKGFFGQVMTIIPGRGPCYRCIFRNPPEAGAVNEPPGVLGSVAGTIGTIQAAEAIKILLDVGELLSGRLLTYDALGNTFREVQVKKDPNCSVCGDLELEVG